MMLFALMLKVDVGWGQGEPPQICPINLLQNQNPNLNFTGGTTNYWESFFYGGVQNWFSSFNTAHHIQQTLVVNDLSVAHICTAAPIMNCLYSNNNEDWHEGIFTNIPIIANPFLFYDIRLTGKILECSDEGANTLDLEIRANNGLLNNNLGPFAGNLNPDFEIIGSRTFTWNNIQNIVLSNYQPSRDFSQLEIIAQNAEGAMITLSNLQLNCRTEALTGITINNISNYLYEFLTEKDLASIFNFNQFRWDFGDPGSGSNNFSTSETPIHEFSRSGEYNVCVDIVDENGCCARRCQKLKVPCPIPTTNFTYTVNCTGFANSAVFVSSSTGEDLTYLWNFGGGNISTSQNQIYQFPGNGTYPVTLTVTDACGQTASATQNVVVDCRPPSLTCDRETYQLVISLDGSAEGINFSQAANAQGITVDPSTLNTYNNLTFVISGEVTIDVTAVFNGCKFVALPGALLILNSQYTPAQANVKGFSAFLYCEFFGCTHMWRGIRDEGNQASFLGGHIKDALYGIHAASSGALSLWSLNFTENFVGIYFTSSPSQNIVGCNFQGGGLKPGYNGIPSHATSNLAGIFVEQPQFDIFSGFNGATFLKVGQTGPYPNTFSNIRNGIIANGVLNIEIVNNTFNNMNGAFTPGNFNTNTRLNTENRGNGIIINGGGFNKILLERNTMTNGNNGVVINNTPFATPLIQKNNSITSFINGIWYRDNLLFGSSIDIKDNNTFNCTGSGVRFSNNNGPSFNFDNNTVMQSDGIVTASGSAGLRIASYSTNDPLNYYSNNGVGSITNNRFSISTDHHSNGMVLVDIYNHLTISNNEPFEVLEESSSLNSNGHGILSLTNVKSATIHSNIFYNRVPNTKLSQNILNNVELSAVCCNQTNSLNFGFNYFGSGTGRSTFSQNIMNNNQEGLRLNTNCAIGDQKDKGNIWIGTTRVAKYSDILTTANRFFARESQNGPLVSGSLMGVDADFWPDQLPAVWFGNGTVDAEYECDLNQCELPLGAVTPESQPLAGDIQTLEDMLDHGHIVHEAHIAPSIWAKERWLYGFLTEHPQFLPASELLANFYNNVSTDVTAYEDFYLSINNALMISPGTKSHLVLLRSHAEALKSVHDIKWTAYQEVSNDVLLDELRVLRLEMASLDSILRSVIASVKATTAASLEQIKATVLSLPSDQPYTEAAKMYAAILIDHLTLGDDYVATHHMDDLQYLANLCEPLYKETVFLARNMISHLNVNQNYDDNEICQNTENRKNDKQNVTEVLIYPNPTSGIFYVSSKGKISGYDIKDVSGKVLRSIIGHEPKCNLTDLTPGVYFITVHLVEGGSVTKKIVTLR